MMYDELHNMRKPSCPQPNSLEGPSEESGKQKALQRNGKSLSTSSSLSYEVNLISSLCLPLYLSLTALLLLIIEGFEDLSSIFFVISWYKAIIVTNRHTDRSRFAHFWQDNNCFLVHLKDPYCNLCKKSQGLQKYIFQRNEIHIFSILNLSKLKKPCKTQIIKSGIIQNEDIFCKTHVPQCKQCKQYRGRH